MYKKRMGVTVFFLASVFLSCVSAGAALQVEKVTKIWDRAPHCAFTDLIRFKNKWFCTFREGEKHVSVEGTIRVITSENGRDWRSASLISRKNVDLRDPKLSVTPEGRLMLLGGWRQWPPHPKVLYSWVAFSDDGKEWTAPEKVTGEGRWLWRVTWHEKSAYGIAYGGSRKDRKRRNWTSTLLKSSDGITYEKVVDFSMKPGLTEATLRFGPGPGDGDSDTLFCIHRRDGGTRTALLGTSRPPYREWTWKDAGFYFGGPNFILHKGRWYAAGRRMEKGAKTVVAHADWSEGELKPFLTLPSGGDTSYPGMVSWRGTLWISYYASHEGKTSIYLARLAQSGSSGEEK